MWTRRRLFWQTPARLPRRQAKILGGLAFFVLILAASSFFAYDGPVRFLHAGALGLVSLTNFALVAGSLLPEGRGARLLRDAVVPLASLMLAALLASVAVLRNDIDPAILLIGALPVLAVTIVARLMKRA